MSVDLGRVGFSQVFTNTAFTDFKPYQDMTISSDNTYLNVNGSNTTGSGYVTITLLNGVKVPISIEMFSYVSIYDERYHNFVALGAAKGESTFQSALYSCSAAGTSINCLTVDGNSYVIHADVANTNNPLNYLQIKVDLPGALGAPSGNWTDTCSNIAVGNIFTTATCEEANRVTRKPAWTYNAAGSSCTNENGATLEFQGDGNMVIYDSNHTAVWSARNFM